jgi:[acyl-carrier-protein] S-malonyltransferase
MGRDLAETYAPARAVFDEVDEALGEKLSQLIWEGDPEELTLTANAQPALMAMSLATLRALEAEGVVPPDYVAGHSLGEYSALAAAGALQVADTARLLRLRGQAMQEAVPVGVGAMAALLGLDFETVRAVAEEAAQGEVCQAANEMLKLKPGLKVLYTSGYTENAIIHHGRLDEGVLLLAKPYRKSEMAIMIRKALAD